jgi:hypothetical protein
MAGRIRRSWYAKARKFNNEHRAHDLIKWGLKFIEMGVRWLPADVPVEIRVWDANRQNSQVFQLSRQQYRESFVSCHNVKGTTSLMMCFTTEKQSSRKGRPNLTAIDGGGQS